MRILTQSVIQQRLHLSKTLSIESVVAQQIKHNNWFVHYFVFRKNHYLIQKSKQTGLPLCIQSNSTWVYLNRADVRQALHIPAFLPTWYDCRYVKKNGNCCLSIICSNTVGNYYNSTYEHMIAQISTIANAQIRILIYNGDVDSVGVID
jgi:hypothetical protein